MTSECVFALHENMVIKFHKIQSDSKHHSKPRKICMWLVFHPAITCKEIPVIPVQLKGLAPHEEVKQLYYGLTRCD